jgi:flagellar hook-length control protein FliK
MSVTIVSTPAAPTPATPGTMTDSGSNAATGQDFANLLLGQLALSVPPDLTAGTGQTELPLADAVPADAASLLAALGLTAKPADAAPEDTALSDETPVDAASLLASLGLVGAPTSSALQPLDPSGKTSAPPLSAVSANAGQTLAAQDAATPLTIGLGQTAGAASDGQAAKFAVALAGAEDSATIKTVSTDVVDNTQTITTTLLTANNQPLQRDSVLTLATPVRDQAWAADLGQKVVWLASNDKQSAQLTLNPPQMGPIEISLNIDKGNATVSFASANAEVRDAIETALPKLREMFANAGISLGQTNVGSESFNQAGGNGAPHQSSSRSIADNAILAENAPGTLQARAFTTQRGNGLVNIFA